ncbi:chalcone synthase B [Leptodontidium sp. 2 PMI_412]|nr:chalcone synthase B [Leptodontidium sp. 2 PMI_412]
MNGHSNGTNGFKESAFSSSPVPDLWITGVGSQYPPYLHTADKFVNYAKRFHDTETPVLKMLMRLTENSGIETRACTIDLETGFGCQAELPTVEDIDVRFRKVGVDLTVQACRKALREWGGDLNDITHVVGVSFSSIGAPGLDYMVIRKLALGCHVENVNLQGIGCAGSGALIRLAGELACAASIRKRPARILCFACELCSQFLRHQYAEAESSTDLANMDIAGAIFGDAASAFVLCNEYGLDDATPKFQLLEWERARIPDTMQHMGVLVKTTGFTSIITKEIPRYTKKAVKPLFDKLLPSYLEKFGSDLKIYRTRGNGGSPTMIAVLDLLRNMGRGKNHVVTASFGPGLAIEMAFLRRCRED